jgi:hypothetical protein
MSATRRLAAILAADEEGSRQHHGRKDDAERGPR